LAERVLGKDEVTGPIPVIGSNLRRAEAGLRLVIERRLFVATREAGEGGLEL
jgi:hypothetical protein